MYIPGNLSILIEFPVFFTVHIPPFPFRFQIPVNAIFILLQYLFPSSVSMQSHQRLTITRRKNTGIAHRSILPDKTA